MFCSNKTFEEFESELVYLKEEKGTKKINYFAKKDSQMLGFAKHLTLKKDDSSYLTTFHGIVVTIPNSVSPFPIICEWFANHFILFWICFSSTSTSSKRELEGFPGNVKPHETADDSTFFPFFLRCLRICSHRQFISSQSNHFSTQNTFVGPGISDVELSTAGKQLRYFCHPFRRWEQKKTMPKKSGREGENNKKKKARFLFRARKNTGVAARSLHSTLQDRDLLCSSGKSRRPF